jgi:hypothetical protein
MKIVITIGEFKVELSDTTDSALKYNFIDIKELVTSLVKDYNSIKEEKYEQNRTE